MSESSSSIHPFFQPRKTKTDSEDTFSPPKKVRQSTLTHSKETEEEISSQSINEESLPPTENEKKKKTSSSKRKSKEEKEEIEMAEPHKDKRIKKKSPEMIEPTKPVSHEKSDAKKRDRVANEPEKIKETDFNEKEFKKVKLTKRRNPQRAKAKQVESKSLKSKKVESEQTEAQQVESKQVESKQVEPKQVGSKKAEAQQAEAQQAEAQQAEAQQAEAQQAEDQQAKSKQKEFEQPKKAEPKKPFAFTKKQKAKYPKLLSEETLKAESSCAALRPLCSQESVKKDEFNFYGRIKQKPTKPRHDHEFSRLDRAIYKHGHCPARKIDSSLSPVVPRIENANHIQAIIKNHPHLNIMSTTTTRERPKRKIKRSLHGEKQIRAWLDNHFPDWHTFPSCVRLFKKIVGPRLPESSQQRWVEKYRPRTVDGLLGPKHNHVYLKDWLHKMKIEPTSAQGEPANKKKVRKNSVGDDIFKRMMIKQAKLDEEDDDFVDSSVAAQKIARQQQQQQQNQKEKPLRSNLILVVGDHGVGKTALVYTAAEQEGYEVFEVNAGSRRSGKDITSALREMTTSHLVTFNNKKVEAKPAKEEGSSKKKRKLNPLLSSMGMNNTISEKKSGLLNCFVRKKPDVVHNPDMKPQGPKQSLILLEEVDLLFEEDRGFWPAIVELSQTGKRPIIMTCNDPDQVPFEILCLQTVLNVLPPTIEEILPYLWLVCYAEDYIVDPKDLVCLVSMVGCDLRRLIQTLELYRDLPNPFESISGLYPNMNAYEMHAAYVPFKSTVDNYKVTQTYKSAIYKQDIEKKEEDSLENVIERLENEAFIDNWLEPKNNRHMIHISTADAIVGYTTLVAEAQDDTLSNDILTYTTALCKPTKSSTLEWHNLKCARQFAYEEDKEAIENILPLKMIYQPNPEEIMMEYIPHIRLMLDDSKRSVFDNRTRKTRSNRKRIHLPLNDENVHTLVTPRELHDETTYTCEKIQ